MWFFEKPASLVNDLTLMYEGIVMEHLIRITGSRFGTSAQTKWEPVIQVCGLVVQISSFHKKQPRFDAHLQAILN